MENDNKDSTSEAHLKGTIAWDDF